MAIPQNSWSKFLFSIEGRVTRSQYWLFGVLALALPATIVAVVIDRSLGYARDEGPGGLVFLLVLWPLLAITIKRWHDRDKSGWWILIGLIPIIGSIWALVENGFLRGTEGANRFGYDPLAGGT